MFKELLRPEGVILNLTSTKKDDVLKELVEVLDFPEDKKKIVLDTLKKREQIGSTGIGKGIAIPHCRSAVLDRVYLVVGRSKKGVDFDAIDGEPVNLFFLLCASPRDPESRYLITLGRIAQISRKLARDKKYLKIEDENEFIEYLASLEEE